MDETIELFPYRQPKTITDENGGGKVLEKAAEELLDGSVRILVTPQTAATSTLHVSVVSVQPGREVPCTKSPGVEFYYVVSCPSTGR
jgi:hypothetical protein